MVESILCRQRCLFCEKLFYFFSWENGCLKHSWKLFGKNIQVACPTFEKYISIYEPTLENIKNSQYICLVIS